MAVLNLELETEVSKDEVNDYLRNENGYLTPGWCASWRVQPGVKKTAGSGFPGPRFRLSCL